MKNLLLLFLIIPILAFGQQFDKDGIPVKPNPPRLINDFANIIPDADEAKMEAFLKDLALSSKTRIVVVTTPTLNNYEKAEFAYKIGETWGVGDKDLDNGVVVLVKPKEIDGKGSTFIATGYGLEGVIPDAIAKRIVEYEMVPAFKDKNYSGGIAAALQVMADLSLSEYPPSAYVQKTEKRAKKRFPFLLLIIVFIILARVFSRAAQSRATLGGSSLPFWATLVAMNSMGSHRGSWDNFSSGGGGFGGFGGGSFGGGGAGGDW